MSTASRSTSSSLSVQAELESLVTELNALFASPSFAALAERVSSVSAREDAETAAQGHASPEALARETAEHDRMSRLADYLEGLGDEASEATVMAALERTLSALTLTEGSLSTKEMRERAAGEARACGLLAHLL